MHVYARLTDSRRRPESVGLAAAARAGHVWPWVTLSQDIEYCLLRKS